MFGKNNIFSGVLKVLVLALVVYMVIFFFYPTISLKYFGTAFRAEKAVSSTINSMVGEAEFLSSDQKKAVVDYLETEEGKKVISSFYDAAKKGGEALEEVKESEEVKRMEAAISSKLSKESMEDLMENLTAVSGDLLSRFVK
ncbi:MAG: hypothetical protein KBS81_07835 [Spirochaetales bacterium]|nr:hypothetical protein [Candidatus Physcosoma equi]